MERIPGGYDSDEIINAMKSVEGVIDVHEFIYGASLQTIVH